MNDLKKTALWQKHKDLGAACTDFAGYSMPLNYGSQIQEHNSARTDAVVFDVSHMVVIDIHGEQAKEFLQYIITNDLDKLHKNQALYTCMCNDQGGIIDDLIVYFLDDKKYRLVTNAATKDKDSTWLKKHAVNFNVEIIINNQLAILSIQGPNSETKLAKCLPISYGEQIKQLGAFACFYDIETKWFIGRTGYTGEDGFEVILPNDDALALWDQLINHGIKPSGLAARDTLRLEAGMALYGQDMDETITPFEAGLSWTVDFKNSQKNFIGKSFLIDQKSKRINSEIKTMMIGLVLQERGVLRTGQSVIIENCGEGVITSGTFSPTIQAGIAMARVSVNSRLTQLADCNVIIRGKQCIAKIVKYPFVRLNKIVYKSFH